MDTERFYFGIDPGASGGIALVDQAGVVILAVPMPGNPKDILSVLAPHGRRVFAVIEHVWSMSGWGHVGAMKFGRSVGELHMALTAHSIPYALALPRKWQAVMGVKYPKLAKGERRDKNVTKRRAADVFSPRRVTHATADALLLAEFARRVYGASGELNVSPSALMREL